MERRPPAALKKAEKTKPPQLTHISNCQPSELQTIQLAPETWHMTFASSLWPSKRLEGHTKHTHTLFCLYISYPFSSRRSSDSEKQQQNVWLVELGLSLEAFALWHLSLQASLGTASQLIDRTFSCARGGHLTIHYGSVLFPQSSSFYMRTAPGWGFTKSCPAWRY